MLVTVGVLWYGWLQNDTTICSYASRNTTTASVADHDKSYERNDIRVQHTKETHSKQAHHSHHKDYILCCTVCRLKLKMCHLTKLCFMQNKTFGFPTLRELFCVKKSAFALTKKFSIYLKLPSSSSLTYNVSFFFIRFLASNIIENLSKC